MKYCKHCQTDKFFDLTAKPHSKASGFMSGHCWDCYKSYKRKELLLKRSTPEGKLAARAASAKSLANPKRREKANAQSLISSLRWAKENPGLANAKNAKRHAAKLQRTPAWANSKAITTFYAEAAALGLQVDHVIPLRGKLVSGLHVHNNLQMLTHSANSSKGNRYAPT